VAYLKAASLYLVEGLEGTKQLTSIRRPNEHLKAEAGLALVFAVLLVIFGF